jgi:glucose/arabinose dehydrogenase
MNLRIQASSGATDIATARARIRDVKQGLDELLYVLTDEADGKLLCLRPN